MEFSTASSSSQIPPTYKNIEHQHSSGHRKKRRQKITEHQSGSLFKRTRREAELLSQDRLDILENNKEHLQRLINVTESILLDRLIDTKVISKLDKENIELLPTNEDQVGKLLEILRRKTNADYDKFCGLLDELGQQGVVYNLFLTQGDLDSANDKLCSFLRAHYTDIRLYTTSRETYPVPLGKLFVNMQWELESDEDTDTDSHSSSEPDGHLKHEGIALQSSTLVRCREQEDQDQQNHYPDLEVYMEQVALSRHKRFVVTGEPGSGKTTFIKRVCHLWTEVSQKSKRVHSLSKYVIVLPIILRLVRYKSGMLEIIKSQLTNLAPLELHAIMKCIEFLPSKVLILCDGYDELQKHETIDSLMKGEIYPEVRVILTTRPHGVTILRYLGSQAVEQVAKILGFKLMHMITDYIVLFYKLRKNKCKGERLLLYLREKKPELISLARLPIRLEMMCIVWDSREDLGDLIVDLYTRFIQYLLDHLEQKREIERTPETMILDRYKPLLMQIGYLANNFDKSDRLISMISYQDLQEKLGIYFDECINLGCLVKYNPISQLEHSDWMFTHLSLQEYFLAYFLSKTENENEITTYTKKCTNIHKLEKQQNVLTFVCGMNPSRANSIIYNVSKHITNKEGCDRLLSIMEVLKPNFRHEKEINFPLPQIVDAREMTSSQLYLFENDNKLNNRNLLSLTLADLTDPIYKENLKYIEHVIIESEDGDDKNIQSESKAWNNEVKSIAGTMREVISVHIKSRKDYTALLDGLPRNNVKRIMLSKIGHSSRTGKFLSSFSNLEYLEIADPDITSEALDEICTSLHHTDSIKDINIVSKQFPQALLKLDSQTKINLKVTETDKHDMMKFTDLLLSQCSQSPNIQKLDLCDNKLTSAGREISHLVLNLPEIQTLDLADCGLEAVTIKDMAEVIEEQNDQITIKQLILSKNDLEGAGVNLAVLLQHTDSLIMMDLYDTYLTAGDVKQISSDKTHCDIKKLFINSDHIRNNRLKDVLNMSSSFEVLVLYSKGKPWTDLVPCMCIAKVSNVRVLCLFGYEFSTPGVLRDLADNLPCSLQTLMVVGCNMSEIEDLIHLITVLPPSTTHLDIRHNYYGSRILEITKVKRYMTNLQKLNFGAPGDEDNDEIVTALREELTTDLPQLQVYSRKEDIREI